jgi:transketolase
VHGHGYSLFDEEATLARKAMGWPLPPFELPEDIVEAWRKAGRKGGSPRRKWDARLKASDQRADFTRAMKGDLPANAFDALDAHIEKMLAEPVVNATRVHSGAALSVLTPAIPEMIGGSADLTGSNNTYVKGMVPFDLPDYAGKYVHYGVREHGMAAAMNGMARTAA